MRPWIAHWGIPRSDPKRTGWMLFQDGVLAQIKAGDVQVAFRKWKRPTVKAGGTLMTRVGVLAIDAVDRVGEADIAEADALAAGYESRAELVEELRSRRSGSIHRIRFRWAGPDPRVALRERSELTAQEWQEVSQRLARLDRASRTGPWTRVLLEVVAENGGVRAADLAPQVGRDKVWVKTNVRKLKNLGLTESLGTGYRISPRGRWVLSRLADKDTMER